MPYIHPFIAQIQYQLIYWRQQTKTKIVNSANHFYCFRNNYERLTFPTSIYSLTSDTIWYQAILVNTGSRNGLPLVWGQTITWTNAGSLLIGLLGTNFSEIRIRILSFSFKKMHSILSSAKMVAILSMRRWVKQHWSLLHGFKVWTKQKLCC